MCTFCIFVNLMFYSSADSLIILLIPTLIHRQVVCRLSGGIYLQKEKKNINVWLLRIAEDTLFCFQSVNMVKFSKKNGLWST